MTTPRALPEHPQNPQGVPKTSPTPCALGFQTGKKTLPEILWNKNSQTAFMQFEWCVHLFFFGGVIFGGQ